MQNKYFKYILLAVIVVFIVPQITLASWYNPLSWNWNIFSWFSKPQVIVPITPVSKTENQNNQNQQLNVQLQTSTTSLSDDDIKNATYIFNGNIVTKYTNGKYSFTDDKGINFEENIIAIGKGDLNTDGNQDAAVIINISPKGKIADNNVLAVLLNKNGKPSFLAHRGLPLAYIKQINSISIDGNLIVVKGISYNSNSEKAISYRLLNSKLELVDQASASDNPVINNISPISATTGIPTLILTVNGYNFTKDSIVIFNHYNRKTNFISANKITAEIIESDFKRAGIYGVFVSNVPIPGWSSGTSDTNKFKFTVNNSVPNLTSISPTLTDGKSDFTMIIKGSNFVEGSQVKFNYDKNQIIKYCDYNCFTSSTELRVKFNNGDFGFPGKYNTTVINPTPGGGISNILPFTSNAILVSEVPTIKRAISSISADAIKNGQAILTIEGSNFSKYSVIKINDLPVPAYPIPFSQDYNSIMIFITNVLNTANGKTLVFPTLNSEGKTIGSQSIDISGDTINITVTNPGGKISSTVSFKIDLTLKTEQVWKDPSAKLEENYKGTVSNIDLPNSLFTLTVNGAAYQVNLKTVKENYIIKQNSIGSFSELKNGDSVEVYGVISNGSIIDAEFIMQGTFN